MANIILSKESSEKELKSYFEAVLKLAQSANEFPINLDDVWMLAYAEKGKAVRALKTNFIEGVDFLLLKNEKQMVFAQNGKNLFDEASPLPKNGENPQGGRPTDVYMLSIPCLEYFIARKVRPVFEVYRKVFHKVVTGRKEVIYTEKEVKQQLLDAERQVREAVSTTNRLHARNAQLTAQVKTLVSLYEKEVMDKINILSFIEQRRLTEELKAYMG